MNVQLENDAILECNYTVMYDDINNKLEMSNIALIKYLEEPGGVQTKKIFGGMLTPKGAWILLNWRVKKFKELYWNEPFKVRTWPAKHMGPFSIRNYEVYNELGELTARATTKWVIMDVKEKKMVRNIEDVVNKYTESDKMVFEDDFPRLKEPKDIEYTYKYIVQRRDIDTNEHVNNVKYLEFAYEVLPKEVYDNISFKNIDITYKHSLILGDEVSIGYQKQNIGDNEEYIITLKSNDRLNAIVRLS